MTPLLAVLALARQECSVTFSHPCGPVPVVLRELGKTLGEEMTAEGAVAGRELYIWVTDLPEVRLLAAIAEATGGEWRTTKRGRHLVPDRKREVEARAAVRKEKIEALEAMWAATGLNETRSLDETEKLVREALALFEQDTPEASRRLSELRRQDAGTRLLRRILRLVGASTLVDLPPGSRAVFSLTPTPMQRRLPESARQAFAAYEAEAGAQRAIFERQGLDWHRGWSLPILGEPHSFPADGTLLVVQDDPIGSRAVLVPAQGWAETEDYIVGPSWSRPPDPTLPFVAPKAELALTSEARLVYKTLSFTQSRFTAEELQGIQDHASEATQSLFWGTFSSQAFDQTVESRGFDMVVCAPFTWLASYATVLRAKEPTLEEFWRRINRGGHLPIRLDDGLLTVGAARLDLAGQIMGPRANMAELGARAKDGRFGLEDTARFVAQVGSREAAWDAVLTVGPVAPRMQALNLVDVAQWQSLRLLGTLSEPAWRSAREGSYEARCATLAPAVVQAVRRLVFDATGFVDIPPIKAGETLRASTYESTIVLPNGIPTDARLSVAVSSTTKFVAVQSRGTSQSWVEPVSPVGAANLVAGSEVSSNPSRDEPVFMYAPVEAFKIRLDFGGGRTLTIEREGVFEIDEAAAVPWSKLPETERKQIETHLAKARDVARRLSESNPGKIKP